jgi:hypothetical protein
VSTSAVSRSRSRAVSRLNALVSARNSPLPPPLATGSIIESVAV